MNPILSLTVSFITDFLISAGGCLTTAMVATGETTMPAIPVLLFSLVTGLVAASRRIQATLEKPMATTTTTETAPGGVTRQVTMTAAAGSAAPAPVAPPPTKNGV